MVFLENTRAVFNKIVTDIKRVCKGLTIFTCLIFLLLDISSIFRNLNHLSLLIPYIILAVLSLSSFIFYLSTLNKKKSNKIKTTKKVFKYCKDLDKFAVLIVNIVEMAIFGGTFFGIIMLVLSGVSILFKIIAELLEHAIKSYKDSLDIAFDMDKEPFKLLIEPDKFGYVKTKVMEKVNNHYEKKANAIKESNGEKIDQHLSKKEKKQQKILDLADKHNEEIKKAREEKKIKKKEKKVEYKKQHKESYSNFKSKLKENLRVIKEHKAKKKNGEMQN